LKKKSIDLNSIDLNRPTLRVTPENSQLNKNESNTDAVVKVVTRVIGSVRRDTWP